MNPDEITQFDKIIRLQLL